MATSFNWIADISTEHPIPERGTFTRALHNDDRIKVVWFGLAAGEELSEHATPMPAILHFVSGAAEVMLGTDRIEARPGTWVFLPAHLKHSIRVQSPVVMLLTLIKVGTLPP